MGEIRGVFIGGRCCPSSADWSGWRGGGKEGEVLRRGEEARRVVGASSALVVVFGHSSNPVISLCSRVIKPGPSG